jgi:hypothetical protein
MVALQLYLVFPHGSAAGKLSFQDFSKLFCARLVLKAAYSRNCFPKLSVNAPYPDLLLNLLHFAANAKVLRQAADLADIIHFSQQPPFNFPFFYAAFFARFRTRIPMYREAFRSAQCLINIPYFFLRFMPLSFFSFPQG